MIGRAADAISASTASATDAASAGADAGRASGHTIALLSTVSSSRSDGRLRCTGPGRPDAAMRIASPMSRPSVAAEVAVNDALLTGAAMSAWRISWKPPRPSSQVAA